MKKIFAIIFVLILIIISIINFLIILKKYNGMEKINAKVYLIEKTPYTWEDTDIRPTRTRKRTGYITTIYYSFYYDGIEKYGNFEGNSIFIKNGQNLTIYYNKLDDSSLVYVFPISLIYIITLCLLYIISIFIIFFYKISIDILYEQPNPPLFIQLCIITFGYLSYRFDKGAVYCLSLFFMIVSLGIALQTLYIALKKLKNNKEII